MIFEHQNYRTFLKAVLVERIHTNPAYSLRALARQLGLSGSQLSEVMNGKSNFSVTSLQKIANKLVLSESETEYLLVLGELELQKNPEVRESLIRRLQRLNPVRQSFQDLSVDYFRQISEWYHSAILELVYIQDFEMTPENVARRLQISKVEADLAIDRLLRLELLAKDEAGRFQRNQPDLQVKSPEQNAAMRKFYRQMMNKASVALEEQTPSERWSGYETLPIAEEALPEIRDACDEFFDKVIRISKKHQKTKNVYHLLLHFFNLTHGPRASGRPEGEKK
jgi:uncharacterized protein (TIGR02147 family)